MNRGLTLTLAAQLGLTLSQEEFLSMLRREQGNLTDSQFARKMGISCQYLCDVYTGRKLPGKKFSGVFGYEPVRAYKLKKKNGRIGNAH